MSGVAKNSRECLAGEKEQEMPGGWLCSMETHESFPHASCILHGILPIISTEKSGLNS
jgi:hypothetical protein